MARFRIRADDQDPRADVQCSLAATGLGDLEPPSLETTNLERMLAVIADGRSPQETISAKRPQPATGVFVLSTAVRTVQYVVEVCLRHTSCLSAVGRQQH